MNIEAFFKVTYGLYVVSSVDGDKLNGYISNTVFQVTSDPPQIAIACSKNNFTTKMISNSEVFAVSALAKDTRSDIIGTFGYRSGRDIEKFADFNHKIGETGAPILLDDTLSWFECGVVKTIDVGSHLIFIGIVVDSDITDIVGEPLTYAHYRDVKKGKAPKNAPTYVDPAMFKKPVAEVISGKYYCTACGHIYDPELGDPESGIAPGTKFEDIPDTWVCPVCGAEKADFAKKD
jgi:flavin reductase (DIM6/NTAB) family NADH-FMN oxidoreductase RutF/rubredoxin